MQRLERRIDRVETVMKQRASDLSLLTDKELNQRIDTLLARMGTSREQAIAEYGSLEAYAEALRQREAEEGQHG